MTAQRTGGEGRLQVAEPGAGVSARTLRRRLSSVSGAVWVLACPRRCDGASGAAGAADPAGERQRPGQGVPLVRVPRTLPQILSPGEVDALTAALRTHRARAMVAAIVLGGLHRCEVLGLRLDDLRFGGPAQPTAQPYHQHGTRRCNDSARPARARALEAARPRTLPATPEHAVTAVPGTGRCGGERARPRRPG
jgi:integrase/recombinase XerD